MPTVYDIPEELLVKRLSEYLRRVPHINVPPWVLHAKTGSHAEGTPQEKDWWHTRCASLLRKLYIHGPVGISDLCSEYGGRKRVGYSGARHRDAGSSAIRKPLQQLETAELVAKMPRKGRVITSKGKSLLDRLSTEIFNELVKTNPALAKYA